MPRPRQVRSVGSQIALMISWADDDYICARTLLIGGFLIQGAVLSNTAIEKYLKAVMLTKGLPLKKTHDVVELNDLLKGGQFPLLDEGYLRTIGKAYKMRYPDDLNPGFNLALTQSQMLAELDTTVFKIRSGFVLVNDGKAVKTRLDVLLEKADDSLIHLNSAFGPGDRGELFKEAVPCFEVRVMPDGSIIQATHTASTADDGKFEIEALKPNVGEPLQPGTADSTTGGVGG